MKSRTVVRFYQLRTRYHLVRQQVRYFVRQLARSKNSVVIGNNSVLFSVKEALDKLHDDPDRRIVLFKTPFWLDKVFIPGDPKGKPGLAKKLVQDYGDLDWGQPPIALPTSAYEEFYRIFDAKKHPPLEVIKWKQYYALRNHIIDEIKKRESLVEVVDGFPSIHKRRGSYRIEIEGRDEPFEFPVGETHFFHTGRYPREESGIKGFPKVSHTELYGQPKELVEGKTIFLAGLGRSAIWTAQHFAKTAFVVIDTAKKGEMRGEDKLRALLFKGEKRPENIIRILQVEAFREESFESNEMKPLKISPSDGGHNGITVFDDLGVEALEGFGYCTTGLHGRENLTAKVEKRDRTTFPYSDQKLSESWVAPEQSPQGSLLEATLAWAFRVRSLDVTFDVGAWHANSVGSHPVFKALAARVEITPNFFTILEGKIKGYSSYPSNDQLVRAYLDSYVESQGSKKCVDGDLVLIKSILVEHMKPDTVDRVEDHRSYSRRE